MKKMIIAAAIACVAAFAHAASVSWEGFDITGINGDAYSGDAFLHCVEVASITDKGSITDGELVGNTVASDDLVANSVYSFYFTSTDAEGNTYKSEVVSVKMSAVGTMSASFEGAGEWSAAPGPGPGPTPGGVPEPTSGVLLAIGVAGLALRRKHQ